QKAFLTSLSNSPERTDPEPGERQCETGGQYDASESFGLACLVLRVFTKTSNGADCRHGQKSKARYFEPQLVPHTAERLCARPDPGQHSSGSTRIRYLAGGDAGRDADFSQCRDLFHPSILAASGRTMQRSGVTVARDLGHAAVRGGFVDPQLNHLMKELGE